MVMDAFRMVDTAGIGCRGLVIVLGKRIWLHHVQIWIWHLEKNPKKQAIVNEKRQRIKHGRRGAIRDLFLGVTTHIRDKCTVIC